MKSEVLSLMNKVTIYNIFSKAQVNITNIHQQDKLREQMAGGFVHPEARIKCAMDWKTAYDVAFNQ
ncbi:MAG: hypothetical protein V1775_06200 [Bacteroidota bacterium]